jgi:two-component system sensor histidine kinase RegB
MVASVSEPSADRTWLNAQWLVRLRWAQVAGQAATILVVSAVLGVQLPGLALAAVVGVGLLSNLGLHLHLRVHRSGQERVRERLLAGAMALDVALLTTLLHFTGGPLNPFGFLYLVQIALATVLLPAVWAWTLVALSFAAFGLLLVDHRPLPVPDETRMYGMWVALGVASAFIVHFLLRILSALAMRERELTEARNLAARQERLASLATMAAGAAHELATPLSTVALVAKELEHHLARSGTPQLVEDARLIREQVGRCRGILDQMAGGAATIGEGLQTIALAQLVADSTTGVRSHPEVRLIMAADLGAVAITVPPRAVSQALRSLVTNAQDASPAEEQVEFAVFMEGRRLRLEIRDRGPGMPREVLARVGEPFFTTKAPGRGMGLGLFLARAVIEGVGGALTLDSRPGEGTRVTVQVPMDVAAGGWRSASQADVVSTPS